MLRQRTVICTTLELNQCSGLSADGSALPAPAHDEDGNMTGYDGAAYTWNAGNRLIAAETADKKITFLYDYMGRRVQKQVYGGTPGNWNTSPDETRVFVYDGWNLIRETVTAGASDSETYYVWGLDLSQSTQGAGGIGGLLCAVSGGEVRRYAYDANGNVGQLVNESGGIVARYEYDPFGNGIVAEGTGAQDNPFRFSTKYLDAETGLYYYGFRYYSAELGRWISRDPIEEEGGNNLYNFTKNNGPNFVDPDGRFAMLILFNWVNDAINDVKEIAKEVTDEVLNSIEKSTLQLSLSNSLSDYALNRTSDLVCSMYVTTVQIEAIYSQSGISGLGKNLFNDEYQLIITDDITNRESRRSFVRIAVKYSIVLVEKVPKTASGMPLIKKGTKEWTSAVKDIKNIKKGKINVRVETATDGKKLLEEARGKMNVYKEYSRDGKGPKRPKNKYQKGYEVHNVQSDRELDVGNDLQHIKWYDGKSSGHIYYDKPN